MAWVFCKGVWFVMDKELFKLPVLTLLGGIVYRIVNFVIVLLMVRGSDEWTLEMGNIVFVVDLVMSVVIFIVIGIILCKTYDRKTIFKSATLLVIYSIIVLILEQVTQHLGVYNIRISMWLYLPVEIFTIITSALARISSAESINWLYALPALFAPYLFLFFGK